MTSKERWAGPMLVVEVVNATNLMPKDGQGSTSAFVEVEFDAHRLRTRVVEKDLNPHWNEKLHFPLAEPSILPFHTIEVFVYNERRDGHRKNFLGKVRIHGSTVVRQGEEVLQRYPLEKRSLFSLVKGDIGLKIYTTYATNAAKEAPAASPAPPVPAPAPTPAPAPQQQTPKMDGHKESKPKSKQKPKEPTSPAPKETTQKSPKRKKEQPSVTLQAVQARSIGKSLEEKRLETRPVIMHMSAPASGPVPGAVIGGPADFSLKETSPPLNRDRNGGPYDLVEHMQYLYVRVVKARSLPSMDATGGCDPYVEAKAGNYKGTTKHFEKTANPEWNQIFAFSKERIGSSLLEVVVKDKHFVKDDHIGRVVFDLSEVPTRVPPDSPLAPQWYRLEDRRGENKVRGELMLAVWWGTQADEAFSEAWHSDAAAVTSDGLSHTKSKVYLSPKLWYVRVNVIEAQDLVPLEHSRFPEPFVRVQLGNQMQKTSLVRSRSPHPFWNEDLLFVAAEPFEDLLILTVVDFVGGNREEILGRTVLPLSKIDRRTDHRVVQSRWYSLERPHSDPDPKKDPSSSRFLSRIHLRVCLDGGYHVLDESTHYSSDLRPTVKQLWKPSIGVLELGILSARNLLPMKTKDGRGTTDAYCVAKYGQKWIRTRTLIDSVTPKWNEQYTWEVFDPCTVITIGVFDNNQLQSGPGGTPTRDSRIGKVRIRLSTLESDRVYTHFYPLLVLHPTGVKKMGEIHLAVRFTCSSMLGMMHLYTQPLLPKMHYLHPLSVMQVEMLRASAMQTVALRLGRAEPPLRKEVVEYMLDMDSNMWSMRRSKANFFRIMSLMSGLIAVGRWFNDICMWKNPLTTVLVHLLFLILVCYPDLILPTVFLYMFLIGVWHFRFRPRHPPHMDTRLSCADTVYPDELDEELDTFPTSKPSDVVRMRYDRLRSVAGRIQTVVGDMATQGERMQALLAWRDPRATAIFLTFCLACAVVLYSVPFQAIAVVFVFYVLRHPRFRQRLPSAPLNFYRRLPAKTDCLL